MKRKFYPAFRFSFLNRLYDALTRAILPERRIKDDLITAADIRPGASVLDFGCGTGTLTLMIKRRVPGADVTGLDIDPSIIAIAEEKKRRTGLPVTFQVYDGGRLPYRDTTFDRIVASLVFHHLLPGQKSMAVSEFARVLKPGGEVHIADMGKPDNLFTCALAFVLRRFEPIDENIKGLIPQYLARGGFQDIRERRRFNTMIGTLVFLSARAATKSIP